MNVLNSILKILSVTFFLLGVSYAAGDNQEAYSKYKQALDAYESDEIDLAYRLAFEAKNIYVPGSGTDITIRGQATFLQEGPFGPKFKSFTVNGDRKNYEIKKLLRKIKLKQPPIAIVEVYRTKDQRIVKVKNIGKLPLDDLIVSIDGEEVGTFEKIESQATEEITVSGGSMRTISFEEADGFMPKSIAVGGGR